MKAKHAGFTVEVLQDQGTGSTGTVKKCCVRDLYSGPYRLSLYEETPIVSLFMSKTIPFCTISPKSSIFPVYKTGANGACLPHTNM